MVYVKTDGGGYCIDSRLATQAEYASFLAKGPQFAPPSLKNCKAAAIEPLHQKINSDGPNMYSCDHTSYTPDATPSYPVVCVNECSAAAFCASLGKRLCGMIDDPTRAYIDQDDPNAKELFAKPGELDFACTAGDAAKKFPSARAAAPGACLSVSPPSDAPVAEELRDVEAPNECRGDAPPFDEVFDVAGLSQWRLPWYSGTASNGVQYQAYASGRGGCGGEWDSFWVQRTAVRCCATPVAP